MTVKRTGLGRNLSALLGPSTAAASVSGLDVQMVSVGQLRPGKYQPRGQFDQASLEELAQSIRQQGLLQPLLVRTIGENQFEILAGERRWRASRLAECKTVPVIVKSVSDQEANIIALVENLQREDLNVLEQARAMDRLMQDGALTHQQVAEVLGKSRSAVSNILRLLSLPAFIQQLVASGDLDMGHARAILILDERAQIEAAKLIIEKKLSVRETEALVARMKAGKLLKAEVVLSKEMEAYLQTLHTALKTKVEIKSNVRGRGRVVIHFKNQESLAELVERLNAALVECAT